MLEFIKSKLPEGGFKLDPRWGLAVMAAVAALIAVAVVYALWSDNRSYRALHGSGEAFPADEVMQVLETEAIAYRLHPQSGQVLVREDQLARARMMLAANGVKVAVPSGYELFDKEEPLGTSQFVQDVRLKRSLEGELARSIMELKGVDRARVHLAIDDNSSFAISKRNPAKASVMLQLSAGAKLLPDQVGAVVNLVAGSVPGLEPKNVQVVDQHGALLSRGVDAWGGPVQNWQVVNDFQDKAVANIEQVLAPVLGAGNFRVSVSADIDFSQKEETYQNYGDSPRLRNEVLRDERTLDQLALGVPGSLSNRPARAPAPVEGQPATAEQLSRQDQAATSTRSETTRTHDYDQSVVHIKHPAFSLRQQSVAIVLNAASAPEGGWDAQSLASLESMLKSAAGFNEKRGDTLTISVFPFTADGFADIENLPWWERESTHNFAKLGLAALIGLLLLFLVVRPALNSLTQGGITKSDKPAEGLLAHAAEPSLRFDPEQRFAVGAPSGVAGLVAGDNSSGLVFSELNPLAEVRLPAPGSGLEMQIEHLQMLAKNDPERVSEVIKHWIGRNERNLNG